MEMYLTHEQAGFRRNYSTIDHLLTVKALIEKANEYHLPLYAALMDNEKVFDSVETWATREALWNSIVYKDTCTASVHGSDRSHL